MASQKYANLAQSTLASSYTAGNTTITVQAGDGTLFPSSGDFIVAIDDPPAFFLKCTSRSVDVLTVTSTGQEGTSTSNKASATKVTQVITAGALDNIRIDMSGIGAYANLPASGMKSGDRYRATDAPYEFIYNGSLWVPTIGGEPASLKLPLTTGWSWDNQGLSTTDNSHGYEKSDFLSTAGVAIRTRYRTAPAAPYTITALFQIDLSSEIRAYPDSIGWVFGFRDSGGKYVTTLYQNNATNLQQFATAKWTSSTSFSAYYSQTAASDTQASYNLTQSLIARQRVWLRIADDNTNLVFSVSMNGVDWRQYDSRVRTDFMGSGPNAVGYGGFPNNGAVSVALLSWVEA